MSDRLFGHIPGYPVGSWFPSRIALSKSRVHRQTQGGISGSANEGADSIVLSGGYEDDIDHGDVIIYTGQGGRDPLTGRQMHHQQLNRGNLALAKSRLHGLPVRVIRRIAAPNGETGYRYDGLFRVDEYWREPGLAGLDVWRFRLVRMEDVPLETVGETPAVYRAAQRIETSVLRIVRDTAQAKRIKRLYDYRCQVCGLRLEAAAGPYAEAAHIRPLGIPHDGSDTLDNLLCLCPNHHVLFDYGAFSLADDLSFVGLHGSLIITANHTLRLENVQYHRAHYFMRQGAANDPA